MFKWRSAPIHRALTSNKSPSGSNVGFLDVRRSSPVREGSPLDNFYEAQINQAASRSADSFIVGERTVFEMRSNNNDRDTQRQGEKIWCDNDRGRGGGRGTLFEFPHILEALFYCLCCHFKGCSAVFAHRKLISHHVSLNFTISRT